MKNWDPFVLGPALAIDRVPGGKNKMLEKNQFNLEAMKYSG